MGTEQACQWVEAMAWARMSVLSRMRALSKEAQEPFLVIPGAVTGGHRAAHHREVPFISLDSAAES